RCIRQLLAFFCKSHPAPSGLPRCCLHGRSRRRDGAHLSNGRLASANLRCRPTATHPTCPTHPTGGWVFCRVDHIVGRRSLDPFQTNSTSADCNAPFLLSVVCED